MFVLTPVDEGRQKQVGTSMLYIIRMRCRRVSAWCCTLKLIPGLSSRAQASALIRSSVRRRRARHDNTTSPWLLPPLMYAFAKLIGPVHTIEYIPVHGADKDTAAQDITNRRRQQCKEQQSNDRHIRSVHHSNWNQKLIRNTMIKAHDNKAGYWKP